MTMIKVKLLKYDCFFSDNNIYSSRCLVPFITDHLGWEEVNEDDYLLLISWARSQKDYMLVSYSEDFTVANAIKQEKDRLAKISEKESEKRNKEAQKVLVAEQKKKEKELNKLKKLAEKFPGIVTIKS